MHFFVLNDGSKWITDCLSFRNVIEYIQNHITQNIDVYLYIDNTLHVILNWNMSNLLILNQIKLKYIGNNYIDNITSSIIQYPIELITNLGIIDIRDIQGVLFNDKFYH